MGVQYRASTQLIYQSFDNRLEDEPRVGRPIRQSLILVRGNKTGCLASTYSTAQFQHYDVLNHSSTLLQTIEL